MVTGARTTLKKSSLSSSAYKEDGCIDTEYLEENILNWSSNEQAVQAVLSIENDQKIILYHDGDITAAYPEQTTILTTETPSTAPTHFRRTRQYQAIQPMKPNTTTNNDKKDLSYNNYDRGVPRYGCPRCGRDYSQLKNMKRHFRLECGREPQYPCPFCKMRFKRNNQLRNHMIARHFVKKSQISNS